MRLLSEGERRAYDDWASERVEALEGMGRTGQADSLGGGFDWKRDAEWDRFGWMKGRV